ncbi:protein sorting system archaetidylserine synthase [Halovivax cerinus]|uniref:Protein sorting system archaetidylserine synthase n=1 Tax=Halovivax cerinus TaxID=1487865 RepID=A0ABD5NJI5_9EURY|nr:protein sorting system archaetidylserine synthase [Halovivax cerinus]
MRPRFVGRLGVADAVTIGNAALGFLAVVFAFVDVRFAARLVLLAAVLDGLDGVLARRFGGTPAGPHLDSLADVASFAVAPATLSFVVVTDGFDVASTAVSPRLVGIGAVSATFVAMAVARLGLYTAYDTDADYTEGVQTTLAGTILGAAILAGIDDPVVILGLTIAFCYLMVATIRYPDLQARDALLMGIVHVLAVAIPSVAGRSFPVALLTLGLAYLLLGPWLYWQGGRFAARVYGNA